VAVRRIGFWRRLTVFILKPSLGTMIRRTDAGLDRVPPTGGVIFVANHTSHADPVIIGEAVYDAGRWPQFLAKSSLFSVPVLGPMLTAVRQIPVHRGTADAGKAVEAAVDALRRGESVIIYPEGTTTREPDLWPMRGKTGVARLWLETGAPVIPIVSWGPQLLYDPREGHGGLHLRPRTPVTLAAGPPVDLAKWEGVEPTAANLHAITDQIMGVLRDMMAEIREEPPPGAESAAPESTGWASSGPDSGGDKTGPTPGSAA